MDAREGPLERYIYTTFIKRNLDDLIQKAAAFYYNSFCNNNLWFRASTLNS